MMAFTFRALMYNANWDQQKISVVIDLSDALAPPPPPLTILGTALMPKSPLLFQLMIQPRNSVYLNWVTVILVSPNGEQSE